MALRCFEGWKIGDGDEDQLGNSVMILILVMLFSTLKVKDFGQFLQSSWG